MKLSPRARARSRSRLVLSQVMQQVFSTVNALLREDARARERRLRLRTYVIVPLSPASGVLEWVENTLPFGEYLFGRAGRREAAAHVRYAPSDWAHGTCRERLKEAGPDAKRAAFDEVCAHFAPCFRFFMLEHFADPPSWRAARARRARAARACVRRRRRARG